MTTPTTTEPLLGQLVDEWEVSPSEVIVGDSLGEGAFGEVYRGSLKGPISCTKVQPSLRKAVFVDVAIKLLKCKITRRHENSISLLSFRLSLRIQCLPTMQCMYMGVTT